MKFIPSYLKQFRFS